jgi:hypothetical protein
MIETQPLTKLLITLLNKSLKVFKLVFVISFMIIYEAFMIFFFLVACGFIGIKSLLFIGIDNRSDKKYLKTIT